MYNGIKLNVIFLAYQPCQLVKSYRSFGTISIHIITVLSSHYQGTEMVSETVVIL
jgi:hypothetical protein